MPNWHELLNEIRSAGSTHDIVRRQMLERLQKTTGRNVILYYSGWLQKPNVSGVQLNDEDKNGFMTVIHKLDRELGLDLVLHTPGGEAAATESLVAYLRSMFGTDIRAIVPQLALSAGTMIACACKEILMGQQSSLGPIDPQMGGVAAHGVVEEFKRAAREVKADPSKMAVWQPIIAKYSPTLIGECEKAIEWSNEMVKDWLRTGMFAYMESSVDRDAHIENVVSDLGDHALTKSHARHLSMARCKEIGLKIAALEDDDELQDAVLSLHHACILTFGGTPAAKIIENHNGVAFIKQAVTVETRVG